jgi:hypothetical protein
LEEGKAFAIPLAALETSRLAHVNDSRHRVNPFPSRHEGVLFWVDDPIEDGFELA